MSADAEDRATDLAIAAAMDLLVLDWAWPNIAAALGRAEEWLRERVDAAVAEDDMLSAATDGAMH